LILVSHFCIKKPNSTALDISVPLADSYELNCAPLGICCQLCVEEVNLLVLATFSVMLPSWWDSLTWDNWAQLIHIISHIITSEWTWLAHTVVADLCKTEVLLIGLLSSGFITGLPCVYCSLLAKASHKAHIQRVGKQLPLLNEGSSEVQIAKYIGIVKGGKLRIFLQSISTGAFLAPLFELWVPVLCSFLSKFEKFERISKCLPTCPCNWL
jgi:hypothetical protein